LINAGVPLQILLVVKERITNWGGVDMGLLEQPGDFEAELRERMEEFGDDEEQEQEHVEQPPPEV
jgi:hypothetical protein